MTSTDRSRVRIPGTKLEGWRAIAVGILALYVLLFVILNRRHVEVNFVFYKVRSNELLGLIVILLLGFAAGFIVGGRRQKTRASQAQPRSLEGSSEATAPPEPEEEAAVGHGTGQPADG
jgi:uncharacterized integral membrane protein